MSKKASKGKKTAKKSNFELEEALSNVNRYLAPGFKEYIQDKEVKSQRAFDELLKEYGELR